MKVSDPPTQHTLVQERDEALAEAEVLRGIAEWSWAVGLFEGEGCITFQHKASQRHLPVLALVSTDRDVVERFASIMGFGTVIPRGRQQSHHKDQWLWKVSGVRAAALVREPAFFSQLGARRQARVLEVLNGSDHGLSDRRFRPEILPTHCRHGHAYDYDNTYLFQGVRYCRACRREDARRYRERKRDA